MSDKNVKQNDKPREAFYGLSSGDGRVLLAASREKYVRRVGIDPIKVWLSSYFMIVAKLTNKISIRRGNIFNFNARKIYFIETNSLQT